jgi:hypothetical protein
MSQKLVGLSLLGLLIACAGPRTRDIDKLWVGHGTNGELVFAATHYDAMNGLAIADSDVGVPARADGQHDMYCSREVLTGTHLPRWICRYKVDAEKERQMTQETLSRVQNSAQFSRIQRSGGNNANPQ